MCWIELFDAGTSPPPPQDRLIHTKLSIPGLTRAAGIRSLPAAEPSRDQIPDGCPCRGETPYRSRVHPPTPRRPPRARSVSQAAAAALPSIAPRHHREVLEGAGVPFPAFSILGRRGSPTQVPGSSGHLLGLWGSPAPAPSPSTPGGRLCFRRESILCCSRGRTLGPNGLDLIDDRATSAGSIQPGQRRRRSSRRARARG